jgi:hypothetical protein
MEQQHSHHWKKSASLRSLLLAVLKGKCLAKIHGMDKIDIGQKKDGEMLTFSGAFAFMGPEGDEKGGGEKKKLKFRMPMPVDP